MARRATSSIRTPSGVSLSQAAGPHHAFPAVEMMSSIPMTITDFNVNSSILDDIMRGIKINQLLEQISAADSGTYTQMLNDFIAAGVNTRLLAPGENTDPPDELTHDDGSDGTFMCSMDDTEMLMPTSELIIERNAALPPQGQDGSKPFDPVRTIQDSNMAVITHVIDALLEVIQVRHQEELEKFLESEVLPIMNQKIDDVIAECNARISDIKRFAAEADERASIAATEI